MNAQHLETDVLVVGAGGAGMYAAIAAAGQGAEVLLLDKSFVGRSGATVMAQMTVAAAVGEAEPDDWRFHLKDTIAAGRGLVNEPLACLLCEGAPARIREMDHWGVGWARDGNHLAQVHAPGHDRNRCVYVDFLNTGPAVSRTLRARLRKQHGIRRISDLIVTDILVRECQAVGAVALHLDSGRIVTIAAKAIVIATGGLTKLYWRNSASSNMGGDGYALALRAGAELVDMEFVQFFPIGHLAPRLIGMDPIMWDPFRYKLGGRLLNARGEEFTANYGTPEDGSYRTPRDLATYAIYKEVEAGRGSPHGGAFLSFEHIPSERLRGAFGPIIDRLATNGIDLTKSPVEVAPIAHYHMGGIRVDTHMASNVPGLFAAGEAVGGANGANRLSGNAVTEALVFGDVAGRSAAEFAAAKGHQFEQACAAAATAEIATALSGRPDGVLSPSGGIRDLQTLMRRDVGPFRRAEGLCRALSGISDLQAALPHMHLSQERRFNMEVADWFELRNMLLVAECVARSALARQESRGAHRREDFPETDEAAAVNQVCRLPESALTVEHAPVIQIDTVEAMA
jgi:succinate dehydrogenase/fumarate reductase flavoprotein subunit